MKELGNFAQQRIKGSLRSLKFACRQTSFIRKVLCTILGLVIITSVLLGKYLSKKNYKIIEGK